MALDSGTQKKIITATNAHWKTHVGDTGFCELVKGKEPGHRIADYVDDRTTALLKVNLDTRYEAGKDGKPKKRSMGDVWVQSCGMFNPINVKAGLQDMNGQPNVVSMQKLLDYIFQGWIDSYYLLIIKFDLGPPITHKAVLIDLLEWTDFITYDAGPGQIMLRERDFFQAIDQSFRPPAIAISQKVGSLFDRFEEGVKSLVANRRSRLERQKKLLKNFSNKDFVIDQSSMKFSP